MLYHGKMFVFQLFITLTITIKYVPGNLYFFKKDWGPYDEKYSHFPESERLAMKEEVRRMFSFGYDNYMRYAFPQDELDPIHCNGRGPDYDNPSNININDVLGDYSLTLVDALDTLVIMGNVTEFKRAVTLVLENVSFENSNTVQVFEATIRILGALLSAHLMIEDPRQPFGPLKPEGYDGELLHLAHDLGARLLPAFENTITGIPYPRVNLKHGVPKDCLNETCTSGAGTLILEFSLLSHLLKDPIYESVSRRALEGLWRYRSNVTGLLGNVINIQSGEWVGKMSGLGAGLDSLFEYLLKVFIIFGNQNDLRKFNEAYETIKFYMRRGRKHCNKGNGFHPIYVNVNMRDGEVANNWIDALQASWAGVQVLNGDIEEAICSHALYYSIWLKYGVLPERYNWHLKSPDVLFYPLRPEFVESTYLLYRATKNPFYLHVGRDIVESLNRFTKVKCGYATVHNVLKKEELEDRMESFFLSETCKYLYLLFDDDNHVNKEAIRYVFTTEGHVIPVDKSFRKKPWQHTKNDVDLPDQSDSSVDTDSPVIVNTHTSNYTNCDKVPEERTFFLPVKSRYLHQLEEMDFAAIEKCTEDNRA